MKTAVVLMDGLAQIVFTPETNADRYALSFFQKDSKIETLSIHRGSMLGNEQSEPFTASISKCNGGWFRYFQDDQSKILIVENTPETHG